MRPVLATCALILGASVSGCGGPSPGTCEDITSIDNNWDNDMKCKNTDGSIFYTDYQGAADFEASN